MKKTSKTENRELCELQKSLGIEAWCTQESCIYWRLLEPQDIDGLSEKGCGLQHYKIVDSITPEMADWLLGMKRRLEDITPESAKSRITFRRREEKK
ncbi:MAG: hypothetical protein IBX61_01475 [Thermoleophilia bacterium]|nr:hypothetical protein [Thermoleophilia bacterium]